MANEVSDLRPQKFGSELLPTFDSLKTKKLPCPMLLNSLNVTFEGYLTLCCAETPNYLAIEDLGEMSFKDAWYSEAMATMRKRHIEGDIPEHNAIIVFEMWTEMFTVESEALFKELNMNQRED